MDRRRFLKQGAGVLVAAKAGSAFASSNAAVAMPEFKTANTHWQATYDAALAVLQKNVQVMPSYDKPVLIEGSVYRGIWMECGPTEALVYRKFRPDVARNSHTLFFDLQRADGQLPAYSRVNGVGFGQIQMVVSIATTAWELAQATADEELLHHTYAACSKWDEWLMRYRNTRGTGLIEGFCTYDTGNDNSPRWAGVANGCPDGDAKKCPPSPGVPRLCPDLSATTYGARIALAAMAKAMGKNDDADRWMESAANLRDLILSKLYVEDDAAFYDLDSQNHFVKIRSEIITRVCGEHVPDQRLFDELWRRQIHSPEAFWTAYPLPSIAVDDPHFVRPIPRNSWGGASQALTALRAGRWFDYYGRSAEFSTMMDVWCAAIQKDGTFRTQIDPLYGGFTQADAPSYSPCALVMMDYTWRLAGLHEEPDALHWNVRLGHPAANAAKFRMRTDTGVDAEMRYDAQGCEMLLAGKSVGRVEQGAVRLITTKQGVPQTLVGISEEMQKVTIRLADRGQRHVTLKANERVHLDSKQ